MTAFAVAPSPRAVWAAGDRLQALGEQIMQEINDLELEDDELNGLYHALTFDGQLYVLTGFIEPEPGVFVETAHWKTLDTPGGRYDKIKMAARDEDQNVQ